MHNLFIPKEDKLPISQGSPKFIFFVFFNFLQISTLRFANRMMCITITPAVNEKYDPVVSLIASLHTINSVSP